MPPGYEQGAPQNKVLRVQLGQAMMACQTTNEERERDELGMKEIKTETNYGY